jgi:hypothetical protein
MFLKTEDRADRTVMEILRRGRCIRQRVDEAFENFRPSIRRDLALLQQRAVSWT